MKTLSKFLMSTLIVGLISQPLFAQDKNQLSASERSKIESVVHDYLINKPEVIVEAMQTLQKRQYEETQQTVKQTQKIASTYANALFHQANDPIVGNAKGTVNVTEFFDYQCPHCIDMVPVMETILKNNPNVRIVYKEFPIRGPQSDLAARAALAANKQGKYKEYSHALLTANHPLNEDFIQQVAKNLNLNMEEFNKDLNAEDIKQKISANIKLAQDLKLFGTPAFFVGTNTQKK